MKPRCAACMNRMSEIVTQQVQLRAVIIQFFDIGVNEYDARARLDPSGPARRSATARAA
jgi:hypothetical protein